jgi:hypothetical protein
MRAGGEPVCLTDDRGQCRAADLGQAGQGAGELSGVGPPVGSLPLGGADSQFRLDRPISLTSVATSAARSTNATAG